MVGLLVVIGGVLGGTRESTPSRAPPCAAADGRRHVRRRAADPRAHTRTAARPTPTRSARTSTVAPTRSKPAVYYRSCEAAQAAGVAPLRTGDPGYRTGLDPDGDGVACEVA